MKRSRSERGLTYLGQGRQPTPDGDVSEEEPDLEAAGALPIRLGPDSVTAAKDELSLIYHQAQQRKKSLLQHRPTAEGAAASGHDHGQVHVSVSKMWFCNKRGKGIPEKPVTVTKVYVHKSASYISVLNKIKEQVYGNEAEGCSYYIADASGSPICTDSQIHIQQQDGTTKTVPWSIETYMHVSNIRFQSKLRLYCVRKSSEVQASATRPRADPSTPGLDFGASVDEDHHRAVIPEPGNSDHEEPRGSDFLPQDDGDGSRRDLLPPENAGHRRDVLPPENAGHRRDVLPQNAGRHANWNNPFDPMFTQMKESEYRAGFSLRMTSQRGIVECSTASQICDVTGGEDTLNQVTTLNKYSAVPLLHFNPCHLSGVVLSSISIQSGEIQDIHLVREVDDNGRVHYYPPVDGIPFSKWRGAFIREGVGLLACVALGGYHSLVEYRWYKDGVEMNDDKFPIVYIVGPGMYMCTITCADPPINSSSVFRVEPGMRSVRHCEPAPVPSLVVPDGIASIPQVVQHVVIDPTRNTAGDDTVLTRSANVEESQISQLKLIKEIGQGTFGTVFKAVWEESTVAAKVVQAEPGTQGYSMILKECDVIRSLCHPNLLRLVAVTTTPTGVALLTNFVEGKNLHSIIFGHTEKELTHDDKMFITLQCAQAIVFLHSKSLVHLDIKPGNVLVEEISSHVYLADFGLARILTESGIVSTQTCKSAGTPGFQSKEVLKAECITAASDVYSMGCVLIELFAGRRVWSNLIPCQIMCKVVVDSGSPPTDNIQPQEIQDLCTRCVSSDPSLRPSAGMMLHSLICIASPQVIEKLLVHAYNFKY